MLVYKNPILHQANMLHVYPGLQRDQADIINEVLMTFYLYFLWILFIIESHHVTK